MSNVISVRGLKKSYGSTQAVAGIDLSIAQGEIFALLGPNGAGKTTSFYMVTGLVKPNEGNVYLDEQEITREPMYRRAQLGIGYLPQEASVFRKLSIEDNIKAILEMTKLSKKEQSDKLEILLEEFMKPMGISARQLAADIDVSPSRISEIVNGLRPITADTALRLGLFFSMEPRFWLNLQTEYDMRLATRTGSLKIASRVRVFQPPALV